MKHFDAIVIGSGQAGTPLAKKLALAGKNTAIIEKNVVGGTCINVGCTPTKAMIASAGAAHAARKAGALGIEIGEVKVNLKKIKERKDHIVSSFRGSSEKGLESTEGLTLLHGEASFTGEKELLVKLNDGTQEKMTADLIFINVGATPTIPAIDGSNEIEYLTSSSILDLEEIPQHLVVIGGNYIGLEFGQMFSRFGSQVTILERSERIMSREDEDVSEAMTKIFEDEGIEIVTDMKINKIEKSDQITIQITQGNEKRTLKCSHVLVATGRTPQTKALQLQNCGVAVNDRGYVTVDEKLRTNVEGIFALGDVKGGPAFTHISYNDYTIVYRNLFEKTNYTTEDRPMPYCMFTDPQLGRIGISESEAKEKNLNIKVAKIPMSEVARGIETNETLGFMKAIVDTDTKQILGASILAAQGGEIMSVLEMAMEGGITYDRIRYCVFAHPTYSESLNNLFMKIED
ncbi:mercuric reductase [Pedobacter endophyticus]|uniref:Mercuric reductase n=1 Tax=Pedobacter endophyticus TaxID=2789740 RepID=A0A7S9L1L3_9SPHI|nr:mercuric reductase [Pedobacter endophyticus]QPH40812.1 mercuric reductase [Pedobacter endophyticus]